MKNIKCLQTIAFLSTFLVSLIGCGGGGGGSDGKKVSSGISMGNYTDSLILNKW